MPFRHLPWHRRLKVQVLHYVTRPIDRLFIRFPRLEYGLAAPQVTRLVCRHEALAGRRAVHLSDLHLDHFHARHDTILSTVRGLNPDWIFITGDLLSGPWGLPHLFRFLGALRQTAPVYVTLGNHDYYSGVPVDRFADLADRHKVCLLINQTTFIPMPSGELGIIGLDDPVTHRADTRCIPPAVPGRFTVLLAHAPSALDLLESHHAADLILCGHSHGGQWRIPSVRPFWLPYGCRGRAEGNYEANGRRMYVNRGLGWSLLPIRWNCPPEIVLVEWLNAEAAEDRPTDPERG